MAKHMRFLSALLICVFLLTGCGAQNPTVCKNITCQDVIRAYSAYEQYQVVHQEYNASEPLLCFVRVDAPDGDYAYFTFYDTPEHAQEDYRPYNMVTWLFALIFAVFTVVLIWEFSKKRMGFTNLERWCIAAVWGGGLGNMIDRLRIGYVVDMIQTEFMDFPVFNVADCFITCGCILLMIHLFIFNKDFWKEEKK